MHAVVEERWREERRGRLLDAAAKVFAARGFKQASMDEIAHGAPAGRAALYRHVSGKDALFAAVGVEALNQRERRLHRTCDPEAGIEAQLVTLVRELVPMFRQHLVLAPVPADDAAAADLSRRRIFRDRQALIAGSSRTAWAAS